jgi:uncharacterized membrane protein (DUF4010 family)
MPNVTNPTEIRTALTFGALYALILVLAAWLQDVAGNRGIYLLAVASGLTDVDAITLSSLRMFGMDKLTATQTITAITLATLSNLAFKSGLVVVIGGAALARRVPAWNGGNRRGTCRRPIADLIGNIAMPIRKLVVAKGIYYVEIPRPD